jgi:ketosteroid isomerase-like protein
MREDEIIVQVQKINSEFYHAFENLSIERMAGLWKHEDNVVCIHPGWDLFTGWLAIRESWITIFRNTQKYKGEFIITNTKVSVFDNIAVVVCLENIETLVNGEIVRLGVIATNIFEQMENQRLLIHHHGSSVLNYIPPNISS